MNRATNVPTIPLPAPGSVACVVVTYHPDQHLGEQFAGLVQQVGAIIVVDNGSGPGELELDRALSIRARVDVIANRENRGVAAALNQGFRRAQQMGFRWVLALDQDSGPQPTLVREAARVYIAHPQPGRLAAIGAGIVGETAPVGLDQPAYRRRPVVITSGTLYPVSTWESLGGFREDYFIDYVDIEYCLRARARGFDVVQSTGPCLVHRIGHPAPRRALGRLMTPTNHDASRRYYITRNRISVWRGYMRSDRRYVLHDMRQFAREGIMVLLAESDRVAKVRAILRGSRDGARGRLGPAAIAGKPR